MNRKYIVLLLLGVLAFGFIHPIKKDNWKPLFNGKNLSGWDTYLGPDMDDNGKVIAKAPLGLNNDPRKVFTIIKQDGENCIRVSGENWGAIITKKEYQNYHLQLQFKWGQLLWGQKKKGNRKDSGLLYHSVGPYGADFGAWMRAQEFQIEEGTTGDYWGCAGAIADIPANKAGNNYVYSPQGTLTEFSETNAIGRHCTKQGSNFEQPSGEWNTLDLYCNGDTSIHVVNGRVAIVLYHNKQAAGNGLTSPLVKGKIQLQSEGGELYYRRIQIRDITQLPAELLKE
jgi:hypothetical protein